MKYCLIWFVLGSSALQAVVTSLEQAADLVKHLQRAYINDPEMVYDTELQELLGDVRAFLENHTGSLEQELLLQKIAELEEKISPTEEHETIKGTRRFNKLKVNELRVYNMTLDGGLTHDSATFLLPDTVGISGQVLATSGTNPDQLYWATVATSSTMATGTSADIPNTLVLRDNTGSFVATNIVLTGAVQVEGNGANSISLEAPSSGSYTLILPITVGTSGQVLTTVGTNPDQLSWATLQTNNTSTVFLYGDVTGTATSNHVAFVCGVPACNLAQTYSTVIVATSADIPNTLVLRDNSGSFVATNITVTGALELEGAGANTVALQAPISGSYTLILPTTVGTSGQVLTTAGTNSDQLLWATLQTNNTSTVFLYGDVTGTATNNHVAFVCGAPACNLAQTYSTVISATSADIPHTLVLRDNTGSFVATKVTLTGVLQLQGSSANDISVQAPSSGAYTVLLPTSTGSLGQALTTAGANPDQLYWTTVEGIFASTINLYGDVIGSSTATKIVFICGIPACSLAQTYSTVLTATSCDSINSLVKRDTTGSFVATRVTLTGNSLINSSTLGGCDKGAGFIWAPSYQNTIIGLNAGNNYAIKGGSNVAYGNGALASLSTGSFNVALGTQALFSSTGSNGSTAVGYQSQYNTLSGINTTVGYQSLYSNAGGVFNTACGAFTLYTTTTGSYNCAVGDLALLANVTGSANTSVGALSMSECSSPSASVALGVDALLSNGANGLVAVGQDALRQNTTGQQNTVLGGRLSHNIAGNSLTAIGYDALFAVTVSANTAIGWNAGTLLITGTGNTFIGTNVGSGLLTGSQNILLGNNAGINYTNLESNNILIGSAGLQAENNVLRIGDTLGTTTCFIAGIYTSPVVGSLVTINASNKLGVSTITTATLAGLYDAGLLMTATSADIPNTLVLRDNTGSFASTTITVTGSLLAPVVTVTNYLQLEGASANSVIIQAPGSGTYTLLLPTSVGASGQVLATAGTNPDQLVWTNVQGSITSTINFYGDLVGSATANQVAFVCGVPACSLAITYSSATPCDVGGTLVQRNSTGGFESTALTLTAYNMINYSSVGGCTTGIGYLWAPVNNNTVLGVGANASLLTGSQNTLLGYDAGSALTTATNVVVLGSIPGVNTSSTTYIGNIYNAISGAGNAVPALVDSNNQLVALSNNSDTFLGYGALNNRPANNSNTAVGYLALQSTNGVSDVAVGYGALNSDTSGAGGNVAIGYGALESTSGANNVVVGANALSTGNSGSDNAVLGYGVGPLLGSSSGSGNTIIGAISARYLNSGSNNTLIGYNTANNTNFTGVSNTIVIGANLNPQALSNSIFIGTSGSGFQGTHIGGIYGTTISNGIGLLINSGNRLGTVSSSRKYKENIIDLGTGSENIYKFRPVEFHYKNDEAKMFEAGLIAEEVHEIMPEMVVYKDGEPETVRYRQLPILMLKERQKDHAIIQELKLQVAQLQQLIKELELELQSY